MELPGPSTLRFDEVTKAMVGDLDDLARQVNDVRPLSQDVPQRVRDTLFGELVLSSNAIEGNTLTIRETRLILQTKTHLDIRRMREAQEAINLGEAATGVERLPDVEDAWCDVHEFLDTHEILMRASTTPSRESSEIAT